MKMSRTGHKATLNQEGHAWSGIHTIWSASFQAQADIDWTLAEFLRTKKEALDVVHRSQLKGLGFSEVTQFYALSGLEEARAYFAHPLLGKHLLECCQILNQLTTRTASEIFGFPDDLKFHSCLTLFHLAVPDEAVFDFLLDHISTRNGQKQ
jgi:uncharacterized protein (DUF1810 family)